MDTKDEIIKAMSFVNWAKDSFYMSNADKEDVIQFFKEGNNVIDLIKRLDNKVEHFKKYKKIYDEIRKENYQVTQVRNKAIIQMGDIMNELEIHTFPHLKVRKE